jgi:hypothetical protein
MSSDPDSRNNPAIRPGEIEWGASSPGNQSLGHTLPWVTRFNDLNSEGVAPPNRPLPILAEAGSAFFISRPFEGGRNRQ